MQTQHSFFNQFTMKHFYSRKTLIWLLCCNNHKKMQCICHQGHAKKTKQDILIIILNIAVSNGTKPRSHSELLNEELQRKGCTPPSSQQGNQLIYCALLLVAKKLLAPHAAGKIVVSIIPVWHRHKNHMSLFGCTLNTYTSYSWIIWMTECLHNNICC